MQKSPSFEITLCYFTSANSILTFEQDRNDPTKRSPLANIWLVDPGELFLRPRRGVWQFHFRLGIELSQIYLQLRLTLVRRWALDAR